LRGDLKETGDIVACDISNGELLSAIAVIFLRCIARILDTPKPENTYYGCNDKY